jgi:hypothetical protein
MNSIILDVGIRELLLDDARDFMKSRQWYADRGTSHPIFNPNALASKQIPQVFLSAAATSCMGLLALERPQSFTVSPESSDLTYTLSLFPKWDWTTLP